MKGLIENVGCVPQPSTSAAADEPTCGQPSPSPSRAVSRHRSPSPDSSQNDVVSQQHSQPPPSSPIIRDPQFPDGCPDDPNLAIDPTPPRDWPQWISSRPSHSQETRARELSAKANDDSAREEQPQQGGASKRTLSFSRPKPGNFSYRRRRPDINFLKQILGDP